MLSNVTLSARQIGSRHQKRLVAGTESVGEAAVWISQRVTAACARDDLWLVLQKVASELHPKVRNHGEGPY